MGKENKNYKNSVFTDLFIPTGMQRFICLVCIMQINYNMPLRNLMYIGCEIPVEDRYKKNLVKIPTPDFITFYIGKEDYPLEQTLRLSDAFAEPEEYPSLELKIRVININHYKKHKILEECKILGEYSRFIEIAREQCGDKNRLEKAVKTCISRDILRDYLERKSSEVINMLMVEYDYDKDMEVQRKEAMEEGRKEGIRTGISALVSACLDFGKSRSETRKCLMEKYALSDKDADAYMDEFWK